MAVEQNTQNQVSTSEEPKTKERKGPYRFLNPYNFVRYLERERPTDHNLGNCPPPPHDRYIGLTGRITCRVDAKTPLFISDSHAVRELKDKEKEGHKIYRFFEYEGQPALPASSLRGMIRAIFETATNSCFAVFTNKRLSYHFDSRQAPWLVPARVEKSASGWLLRLLTGTADLRIGTGPRDEQYAAWLFRYWPIKPSGTLVKEPQNRRTRLFKVRTKAGMEVKLRDLTHGKECFAIMQLTEHPHPRIKFWDVVALGNSRDELESNLRDGQVVKPGWLCLTNQNIEPKHSERFFFRDQEDDSCPETISLDEPVRRAYEGLISDYQERHRDKVQNRSRQGQPIDKRVGDEPALSRFVYRDEERQLKGGELVYAFLNGTSNNPQVEFIVPVSVPRVGYKRSIGDLLPPRLHRCNDAQTLCPACRIFGWVSGEEKQAQGKQTAYAGRVRFSHGKPVAGTIEAFETPIPLAILSSPKPTTTNFYLVRGDGQPDRTGKLNYDDNQARLRGRKVYRHHGQMLSEQEYVRSGWREDDQNRTASGVLKSGAFTFTVEFENLAKEEVGALLWALELEGWHHRLGFAKPLGFGSVLVKVEKVEICDPGERYAMLDTSGWRTITESVWRERCVISFKTKMKELYGKDFLELENVKDLQALLTEPSIGLPIHYPRPPYYVEPHGDFAKPNPEGMQFEWFVGNKRRPEPIPLPLASKEEIGLPLLEKNGNEYSDS
ncbi:MAG: TIGR03986 family CRISPR-associated RAMP protein [Acidobacteriota bacterium]